jgi:hypothetical protein
MPSSTDFYRSFQVAREVFMNSDSASLDPWARHSLIGYSKFGERLYESNVLAVYIACSDRDMVSRLMERDRFSERRARSERIARSDERVKIVMIFFQHLRHANAQAKDGRMGYDSLRVELRLLSLLSVGDSPAGTPVRLNPEALEQIYSTSSLRMFFTTWLK